jgi:hypothetical protein
MGTQQHDVDANPIISPAGSLPQGNTERLNNASGQKPGFFYAPAKFPTLVPQVGVD